MNLKEYFSDNSGLGVFSSANKAGEVNSAVYAKPHVTGEDEISFIMLNKRTIANLRENPGATYLFVEKGEGYEGVRLSLTMIEETDDKELIEKFSRRSKSSSEERFFVTFSVNRVSKLIGNAEIGLE